MGLKIVDLFSGIGGFSLSGREVGWETLLFCEIEKFPQLVLKKNFPGILIHSDIKTLTKGIIEKEFINRYGYYEPKELILTGGVPCQPASTAGKRRGRTDDRWLWDEATRLVREVKPAFALFENVTGLISLENGKALEKIFADLENEGYTVESFIIPACGVGAWHRRDRIWIIAYCNKGRLHTQRTEFRETDKRREANTISRCSKDVPDTDSKYSKKQFRGDKLGSEIQKEAPGWSYCKNGGIWEAESSVGRVAHGIPDRMDRLKGLGNAIVPQVAYEIFKAIEQL